MKTILEKMLKERQELPEALRNRLNEQERIIRIDDALNEIIREDFRARELEISENIRGIVNRFELIIE